ncbi:MAG TPA: DUF4339 domain-containing protein [Candidatus Methylacidiphilales bacterium]|nr:DUF4339 domain-containing protein [Candidatus Methylacidiphilales bacterium]
MSDWYYAADNAQKGPINESELKANFATNKLPVDTLVWKEGMDGWLPANQVPAFSFRPPPTPAKIQPPAADAPPSPAAAENPAAAPSPSNPDSTKPVDLTSLVNAKGEALEVTVEDAEKNKIFGILAYLGLLCLVTIFVPKNSPYARYHANQGLVLLLFWVALGIVLEIVGLIFSVLPGSLYMIFTLMNLVYIGPLILMILGIINAAAGKCVPLPVIGGVKLLK